MTRTLWPAAALLLGACAQKPLIYQPQTYAPVEEIAPYKLKIVELVDKSPDFVSEGAKVQVKGRVNLVKGGHWNFHLAPLTPDLLTSYLIKEFAASKRFQSVEPAPSGTKPGPGEVVITGEAREATWDCPDSSVGPLQDSCKYRYEFYLEGDLDDGGVWKQRLEGTFPGNVGQVLNYKKKTAKKQTRTLRSVLMWFPHELYSFLTDPIKRQLASQTPEQIRASVDATLAAADWPKAYALAAGLGEAALLTRACAAMGRAGGGGAEARKLLIQGGALAKEQRYAEAVAKFDEAVALAPGEKSAHFNRALVLAAGKNYKRAIEGMRCYAAMETSAGGKQKASDKIAAWEALAQ